MKSEKELFSTLRKRASDIGLELSKCGGVGGFVLFNPIQTGDIQEIRKTGYYASDLDRMNVVIRLAETAFANGRLQASEHVIESVSEEIKEIATA